MAKSQENLKNQTAQISKIKCFCWPKIQYYIPNVKDGIQIRICKANNESATHLRQFISAEANKIFKEISGLISEKVKRTEAQAKLIR